MAAAIELPQLEWDRRYRAANDALHAFPRVLQVRRAVSGGPPDTGTLIVVPAVTDAFAQTRRVAIFAGSYNPQTSAHALVATAAQQALQLDTFVWAMSWVTVDKEAVARASLTDRIVQLEAYLRNTKVGALVVLNSGLYVDHATRMRALISPAAELWLVVGFDKVVQIFDPHYYVNRDESLHRLFDRSRLLVVPRAHHTRADLRDLLSQPDNRTFASNVDYLDLNPASAMIASSYAREAVAAGQLGEGKAVPLRYLTPEGAALAFTTGAYDAPRELATGEAIDVYALRQQLLAAMEQEAGWEPTAIASADLIRLSTDAGTGGTTLRRWLAGTRWLGGPASLRDLVQRLT